MEFPAVNGNYWWELAWLSESFFLAWLGWIGRLPRHESKATHSGATFFFMNYVFWMDIASCNFWVGPTSLCWRSLCFLCWPFSSPWCLHSLAQCLSSVACSECFSAMLPFLVAFSLWSWQVYLDYLTTFSCMSVHVCVLCLRRRFLWFTCFGYNVCG